MPERGFSFSGCKQFVIRKYVMEAVLLIGLQGAGKSSFYKERYFSTHVRISLDLLRTRYREQRLLEFCLETQQRFVIDNTNSTRAERHNYIEAARMGRYAVTGYYFQSRIEDCLKRNRQRVDEERVPDQAILATAKKLELPTLNEGFQSLFYVRQDSGRFVVEEWQDEV